MKVFIEISALYAGYFTCIDYGNSFMNFTLGTLQNETPRNIVGIKNCDYRMCAKIPNKYFGQKCQYCHCNKVTKTTLM